MKKNVNVLITALILILTGCEKTNECPGGCPPKDLAGCKLQQFTFKFLSDPQYSDSMVFSYNDKGNPVTGLRSRVNTGSPNFNFRYDKYNRLTDFIGSYDNAQYEFWHKYFYDRLDRIVKDSAYIFPTIFNEQPSTEVWHGGVISYEYDAKNRMSKSISYYQDQGDTVKTAYKYDDKGNLLGSTYDNKINFRLTNKIWMFLDRNYSINNPITTASYIYNSLGLPVSIAAPNGGAFIVTGVNPLRYQQAEIKYTCDKTQATY